MQTSGHSDNRHRNNLHRGDILSSSARRVRMSPHNQKTKPKKESESLSRYSWLVVGGIVLFVIGFITIYLGAQGEFVPLQYARHLGLSTSTLVRAQEPLAPTLDHVAYRSKLYYLAHRTQITATSTAAGVPQHLDFLEPSTVKKISAATSTLATSTRRYLWPVNTPYPNAGALLPFNRILAYYGNFYSKGMGVLGEYPEAQVLQMLASTTAQWHAADPHTPIIPAIDYIAVTAQGSAGADGKYRLEMPDSQIDHALAMAAKVNGIVILDVQVGLSTVAAELPSLDKYLKMPQVHLALDPEFAMHGSEAPGTVIGTMDAKDINYASNYLANLVRTYNLPPKILIVHRFTEDMVTHARLITPLPEVQLVMDMDGWGSQAKKIGTYNAVIYLEPVEFTGFKIFYKNDIKPPSTGLLSPQEVLKLTPSPSFIQYQ